MEWITKVRYLKRNLATVIRQIDYLFKQSWDESNLSGMHPSGQIFTFDG